MSKEPNHEHAKPEPVAQRDTFRTYVSADRVEAYIKRRDADAQKATMAASHLVTVDRRDLWDNLRMAWRDGLMTEFPGEAESWQAATEYANEIVSGWESLSPVEAGQQAGAVDGERLDWLVENEFFVQEANGVFSVRWSITGERETVDCATAREAIDAARTASANKNGD